MTGGQPTTRGQRWSSAHPKRRKRDEQMASEQAAWEREKRMAALTHHAGEWPGAVVELGGALMADLSGERGHVQRVTVDTLTDIRDRPLKRVRVQYVQYGAASDLSARIRDGRDAAGELTPEDVHPSATGTHTEFIRLRRGMSSVAELRDSVDQYVAERWDPEWNDRQLVRVGDGDE